MRRNFKNISKKRTENLTNILNWLGKVLIKLIYATNSGKF